MLTPLEQIQTLLESPLWRGSVRTITVDIMAPHDSPVIPPAPNSLRGLPYVMKVHEARHEARNGARNEAPHVGGVLIHRLAFLEDLEDLYIEPVKGDFKNVVVGLEVRKPERMLVGIIVLEQKTLAEYSTSLPYMLVRVAKQIKLRPTNTRIRTHKTLLQSVQEAFEGFEVTLTTALPTWPLSHEVTRQQYDVLGLVAFMGRRNPHAQAALRLWSTHKYVKATRCADPQCELDLCKDCIAWTAHYLGCLVGSPFRYTGPWTHEPEDDSDFIAVCDDYASNLQRLLDDQSVSGPDSSLYSTAWEQTLVSDAGQKYFKHGMGTDVWKVVLLSVVEWQLMRVLQLSHGLTSPKVKSVLDSRVWAVLEAHVEENMNKECPKAKELELAARGGASRGELVTLAEEAVAQIKTQYSAVAPLLGHTFDTVVDAVASVIDIACPVALDSAPDLGWPEHIGLRATAPITDPINFSKILVKPNVPGEHCPPFAWLSMFENGVALGPFRLANHDCVPTADYAKLRRTQGDDRVDPTPLHTIPQGERVTLFYERHCFGRFNKKCECFSVCWKPEKVARWCYDVQKFGQSVLYAEASLEADDQNVPGLEAAVRRRRSMRCTKSTGPDLGRPPHTPIVARKRARTTPKTTTPKTTPLAKRVKRTHQHRQRSQEKRLDERAPSSLPVLSADDSSSAPVDMHALPVESPPASPRATLPRQQPEIERRDERAPSPPILSAFDDTRVAEPAPSSSSTLPTSDSSSAQVDMHAVGPVVRQQSEIESLEERAPSASAPPSSPIRSASAFDDKRPDERAPPLSPIPSPFDSSSAPVDMHALPVESPPASPRAIPRQQSEIERRGERAPSSSHILPSFDVSSAQVDMDVESPPASPRATLPRQQPEIERLDEAPSPSPILSALDVSSMPAPVVMRPLGRLEWPPASPPAMRAPTPASTPGSSTATQSYPVSSARLVPNARKSDQQPPQPNHRPAQPDYQPAQAAQQRTQTYLGPAGPSSSIPLGPNTRESDWQPAQSVQPAPPVQPAQLVFSDRWIQEQLGTDYSALRARTAELQASRDPRSHRVADVLQANLRLAEFDYRYALEARGPTTVEEITAVHKRRLYKKIDGLILTGTMEEL